MAFIVNQIRFESQLRQLCIAWYLAGMMRDHFSQLENGIRISKRQEFGIISMDAYRTPHSWLVTYYDPPVMT